MATTRSAPLGYQVDLAPAVVLPQVEQAGPGRAEGGLGPELGGDEGVEESAEKVAVAHDGGDIEAESGAEKGRIHEVALGLLHEPGESVRQPCRDEIKDHKFHQEPLVCDGRFAIEPSGVGDCLVGGQARSVQGRRLEVAAEPDGIPARECGRILVSRWST